jgi:hypothetical protein
MAIVKACCNIQEQTHRQQNLRYDMPLQLGIPRLSFHGLRAKDKDVNGVFKQTLMKAIGKKIGAHRYRRVLSIFTHKLLFSKAH